jgi:hypothetical protein
MRRRRDEDEHIRRMSEPEPYRSLRLQKERIEHERQQQAERDRYDREAEKLRREIMAMGERPCA